MAEFCCNTSHLGKCIDEIAELKALRVEHAKLRLNRDAWRGGMLALVVIIVLLCCWSISARAAVIETATGRDSGQHVTLAKMSAAAQPPLGGMVIQPETGVRIRRLTDVKLTTSPLSANPAAWNGLNYAGLTNGYSRLQNTCTSGDYMIAYMTTPGAYLVRMSDLKAVRIITTGDGKTKIGDKHELKWSPLPGEKHVAYYCQGSNYYRQDLEVGPSSEKLVGTWRAPFASSVDGGIGMNGLVAMSVGTGVDVMDVRTGELLPAQIPVAKSGGVDVSPSGAWVRVGLVASANYYRVSDLRAGVVKIVLNGPPGHGGWVKGTDGLDWFVQQNANADRLQALEPGSGKMIYLGRVTEFGNGGYGAGFHVATDRYGAKPGWALVSVYQTSGAFEANVFWVELVAAREADMVTPVAAGAGPRIVRLCSMQHLFTGDYTTEGWAGISPDGKSVLWGGNWWGGDNLEVYEATGYELPASRMGGAIVTPEATTPTPSPIVTPTPRITPTPTPDNSQSPSGRSIRTLYLVGPTTITITQPSSPVATPDPAPAPTPAPTPAATPAGQEPPVATGGAVTLEAAACNSLYWGSDSLSGSTRGNYHTVIRIRPGTWTYRNSAGTTSTSSFDQVWKASYHHTSIVARWDLPGLAGAYKIKSARARFDARNPAGASDGCTLPRGNERIAIRTLNFSQDWTAAYLIPGTTTTREVDWNGASFLSYREILGSSGSYESTPWSTLPSRLATYGRAGDITSVRGPIIGEISWSANGPSYSTDLAPAINAALAAGQTQFSIFLDPDSALGTDWFGNNSNTYNPKFGSHVALYPITAADPAQRPAIVLEIE